MKRIAMLHYAYPPNVGGVEILLREHAKVLADLGYGVKVLTGSGEEEDERIELIEEPKLQAIRQFNLELQNKIEKQGIIEEEFYALASEIEEILKVQLANCDVIIVHNVITLIHNLALNFALRNYIKKNPHKKFILWTHDHKYITEEQIKPNLKEIYHTDFINELLTKPVENAHYVVVSEVFRDLLFKVVNLNSANVVVIPAGVDVKRFLGVNDMLWSWLLTNNIIDKFPIFLSPANIIRRKNIDFSIEVFAEIKKKYPDSVYIITGKTLVHRSTTEYRLELEEKIKSLNLQDSVLFLSEEIENITFDDIISLYRLSDVVLYLSKSENFGIPIIESAFFKTHIFASDLQVFKEIAEKNEIDYVDVNQLDAEKTAEKILNSINYTKLTKFTGKIRKNYNLHTILEHKLVPLFK